MNVPIVGISPYHEIKLVQQRAKQLGAKDKFLEIIAYAYELAPRRTVRWDLVVIQSALETGWGTSEALHVCNNTAGIKWGRTLPPINAPAIGKKYRIYPTLKTGVADQIDLLAVYAGIWVPNMPDETRNTRLLGKAGANPTHASLQGTWAEATHYTESLERIGKQLFGYWA